jgi:PAS domain S-box-containing protein
VAFDIGIAVERSDKASIVQPERGALAPALRIVLLYILFGIIWFSLVDRLLLLVLQKPSALATWDTLEPWTFVGLTSIVLLLAVRLTLRRIQTSEQRWKLLFDAAPDAYYLHDMNGTFLDGNRAAEELTGYHKAEIVGKNLFEFDLLMPDDLAKAAELLQLNRQGKPGGPTSYMLKKKNGTFAAIEVRTLPIQLESQHLVIGIARDVTERRIAEDRLRESEARFSAIFHASPIAISITDFVTGRFIEVNDTLQRTFGYQRHELIGRTALELGMWSSAEDRAELVDLLRAHGRVQQLEAKFRRKSGDEGDLLISAELVRVEGKEYMVGMLLDITMRKRLEAQLLQAQKMEAIGQLAGGVAHDFNNILAAQLLQLQLIERRTGLDPEVLGSLQELEAGIRRAASLPRQLLLFSRRQLMQTQRIDADEVIVGLMKMLKRLLGEHIQATFNPSSKPAWVDADVGMLEQVIVNLCVNARDAMPNGGKLGLATEVVSLVPQTVPEGAEAKVGSFVCITVQDTGCGMDESTLKRIFEPFFTTKEPGKGTGLGLATVHGIAKQHHGWVQVQSALGRGTTFRVYLPAKDALLSTGIESNKAEPPIS